MMVFPADALRVQNPIVRSRCRQVGVAVSRKSRTISTILFAVSHWESSFRAQRRKRSATSWVLQSLLILGVLSVLMIGGLVLTYRSVNKQVALARLKSDFVSNVSHELRTPLALIRLYAETLELGRITTQEKKNEYYSIIRKESERLTRLNQQHSRFLSH